MFFLSPSVTPSFDCIFEGFFLVPSQRCDVLVREASVFLTNDEEFVLELSRLHWKTFKENVWKSEKDLKISSLDRALAPSPRKNCNFDLSSHKYQTFASRRVRLTASSSKNN